MKRTPRQKRPLAVRVCPMCRGRRVKNERDPQTGKPVQERCTTCDGQGWIAA